MSDPEDLEALKAGNAGLYSLVKKLRKRVVDLELMLVYAKRAYSKDAPADAAKDAELMLNTKLDPTMLLDLALDQAWRDGVLGGSHPCSDSTDPESRELAQKSTEEMKAFRKD